MPIYTCPRCGFITKHKNHFVRHITRKNVCHAIIKVVSPLSMASKYGLESQINTMKSKRNFDILSDPASTLGQNQNVGWFSCCIADKVCSIW